MTETDIVERLRDVSRPPKTNWAMCLEAADEIERLARHIKDLRELREFDRAEIERLRAALHVMADGMDEIARAARALMPCLRRVAFPMLLEPKP